MSSGSSEGDGSAGIGVTAKCDAKSFHSGQSTDLGTYGNFSAETRNSQFDERWLGHVSEAGRTHCWTSRVDVGATTRMANGSFTFNSFLVVFSFGSFQRSPTSVAVLAQATAVGNTLSFTGPEILKGFN